MYYGKMKHIDRRILKVDYLIIDSILIELHGFYLW